MSEGLGQKYGAPRRRAQERIRTEVSRDEQSAGFVDELLAKLEFYCSEKQRIIIENGEDDVILGDEDDDDESSVVVAQPKAGKGNAKTTDAGEAKSGNGIKEYSTTLDMWKLSVQLRAVLSQRLEYLEIVGSKKLPVIPLPWLPTDRIKMFEMAEEAVEDTPATGATPEEGEDDNGGVPPVSPRYLRAGAMNLSNVVVDVDAMCRKETRDLYISEGKEDMLQGDSPDSVPESLETWLGEEG